MKRTREDSRIEIWGARYINVIEDRHPEDRDAQIVQIEPAGKDREFIVEIVRKEGE